MLWASKLWVAHGELEQITTNLHDNVGKLLISFIKIYQWLTPLLRRGRKCLRSTSCFLMLFASSCRTTNHSSDCILHREWEKKGEKQLQVWQVRKLSSSYLSFSNCSRSSSVLFAFSFISMRRETRFIALASAEGEQNQGIQYECSHEGKFPSLPSLSDSICLLCSSSLTCCRESSSDCTLAWSCGGIKGQKGIEMGEFKVRLWEVLTRVRESRTSFFLLAEAEAILVCIHCSSSSCISRSFRSCCFLA